ncbi:MAG: phosphoribosylformylglycinamidine cyclo-ligase [Armatimonadetes bacterium]|nr:phosphoribosylformylglycinamidine cyclo-ligase [Armatimonadota bacterium]
MSEERVTYQSAGVDIDGAQRALRSVSSSIQATHGPSVIGGIGGFGALFRAQFPGMEQPVLVSSIDGVGTKTKVAAMVGDHSQLGADIVNHCVNDILCQGARPLFFLDYFGCGHLQGLVFEEVVGSMASACAAVDCALIGGETAEMPQVYHDDEIDIVGSIVGIVDFEKKLPRREISAVDVIIGLASNGLHTNGYSLARRALFEVGGYGVRDEVPGTGLTIGEDLLRPHRCYFNSVYPLLAENEGIRALAHLTGGGFFDNIPRVLPSDLRVVIEKRAWTAPPIFHLIQQAGGISDHEMHRTFNMGIGMVMVVDRMIAPGIVQQLIQAGENAAVIGEVQNGGNDVQLV